jgi:hypothetical protein
MIATHRLWSHNEGQVGPKCGAVAPESMAIDWRYVDCVECRTIVLDRDLPHLQASNELRLEDWTDRR